MTANFHVAQRFSSEATKAQVLSPRRLPFTVGYWSIVGLTGEKPRLRFMWGRSWRSL